MGQGQNGASSTEKPQPLPLGQMSPFVSLRPSSLSVWGFLRPRGVSGHLTVRVRCSTFLTLVRDTSSLPLSPALRAPTFKGTQDSMQQCQKLQHPSPEPLQPPVPCPKPWLTVVFIPSCLQNSLARACTLNVAFLGTPASPCFGGSESRCDQLWSSLKGQGNSGNAFSTGSIQLCLCERGGRVSVCVCVCIDFIDVSISTHLLFYL